MISGHRIIGIIGTRRRDTGGAQKVIEEKFLEIYKPGDWICSGGCPKGGDRFAEIIAKKYAVPILIFYPDWNKKGKGAGLIRNGDIADSSDLLIACVATDRTGGAEDTIRKFLKKKGEGDLYLV